MNGQEEGTHYREGSTHTALSPGSRVGMHWRKMFPWTLKNTNTPMFGNTRQVELCLLETEPFTLSILSTPSGLWCSSVNKT